MDNPAPKFQFYRSVMGVAVVITVVAVLGLYFSVHLADQQFQRDKDIWNLRIGLLADQKQSDVEDWVYEQYITLQNIGYSPNFAPLFGSNMEDVNIARVRSHLNNIAKQRGFLSSQVEDGIDTVPQEAGIMLLNDDGDKLLATSSIDPSFLKAAKEDVMGGIAEPTMIDVFRSKSNQILIGFIVPLLEVDMEEGEPMAIGYVVGVKPFSEVYSILSRDVLGVVRNEVFLVRNQDSNFEYLTPVENKIKPLEKTQSIPRLDNDVAFAIVDKGIVSEKKTQQLRDVMVTGRAIDGTKWTLVTRIDSEQALQDAKTRKNMLVLILACVVFALFLLAIVLWRHGASLKNAALAKQLDDMLLRAVTNERVLSLVADNQPDPVVIIDQDGFYHFANLEALKEYNIPREDVIGKSVESIVGPSRAIYYRQTNQKALADVETVMEVRDFSKEKDQRRVVQAKHIPVAQIPTEDGRETPGVLVVEQDITEVILERELRERNMLQLTDALVTLLDQYDPYASNHSKRVGVLAKSIAKELDLSESEVETVSVAGKLVNLGKIFIPQKLLTKKGQLTQDEWQLISRSVDQAADIIKPIEFKGQVYEALRQSRENMDGSGRLGLKNDQINRPARIVAVANAFIALISPRAYREGFDQTKVIEMLHADAGKKYDRTVVAALVTYIDKCGGEIPWDELDKIA